jgi:hypothetical protein
MRRLRQQWHDLGLEKKLSIVFVPLLIAVIAAVLPSVLDGDGEPPPNATPVPTTVTLEEWVASANEICADSNDAIKLIRRPQRGDAERVGMELLVANGRKVLEIGQDQLRQLQALAAPQPRPQTITVFLGLHADINEAVEEALVSLEAGDAAGTLAAVPALSQSGQAFDDAAKKLGATTCAEGASLGALSAEDALGALGQ